MSLHERLPEWIKTKASDLHYTKSLLRNHRLSTVCEEARCPNKYFCFSKPTATFMILGDLCTRNCGFCSVESGSPSFVDMNEPERVAKAAQEMGLRYVVITSVTRDDLHDGGASLFAAAIKAVKKRLPEIKVEVLTPDFKGDVDAISTVLEAEPDVFNHNVETVKRLYYKVRPQADYERSLSVLRIAKDIGYSINPVRNAVHSNGVKTKSGLMLGLGEKINEAVELFKDLRNAGCDFLTIGQYLRPSKKNLPVVEYIKPDVFEELKKIAIELGFEFVASGPLVRSSMNAEEFLGG